MKKGKASKFAGRTTSILIATCPEASTQKFYLSTSADNFAFILALVDILLKLKTQKQLSLRKYIQLGKKTSDFP
jgi:hypothetical protein